MKKKPHFCGSSVIFTNITQGKQLPNRPNLVTLASSNEEGLRWHRRKGKGSRVTGRVCEKVAQDVAKSVFCEHLCRPFAVEKVAQFVLLLSHSQKRPKVQKQSPKVQPKVLPKVQKQSPKMPKVQKQKSKQSTKSRPKCKNSRPRCESSPNLVTLEGRKK
jgi:hypothetical protein